VLFRQKFKPKYSLFCVIFGKKIVKISERWKIRLLLLTRIVSVTKLSKCAIESLVKETFDSFATDYWKELKTVTEELAQLKKSQEFISTKFDDFKNELKK